MKIYDKPNANDTQYKRIRRCSTIKENKTFPTKTSLNEAQQRNQNKKFETTYHQTNK